MSDVAESGALILMPTKGTIEIYSEHFNTENVLI